MRKWISETGWLTTSDDIRAPERWLTATEPATGISTRAPAPAFPGTGLVQTVTNPVHIFLHPHQPAKTISLHSIR
jgi:hypothetical protein